MTNCVFHEPDGGPVDQTVAGEIEGIAKKLLNIAGEMYSKGANALNKAKDKTRKIISDTQWLFHSRVYSSILCLMHHTHPHSYRLRMRRTCLLALLSTAVLILGPGGSNFSALSPLGIGRLF